MPRAWIEVLNFSQRGLCTQGREHEKNHPQTQVFQYYQKAADQRFADGLYKRGQAFFSGMGHTQDNPKGFKCTQQVADQGHLSAVYNLGRAYEKGLGCSVNKSQAVFCYQKAAVPDDPPALKGSPRKTNRVESPSII